MAPAVADDSERTRWDTVDLDDLPSVNDVDAALVASCKSSQDIEAELDRLLSHVTSSTSSRAAILASIAQSAAVASDDAAELASLLDTAARTAQGVSSRIRFLGDVMARGKSALTRVELVLALRVCAEGAKTALSAGDLTSAANHVQRYLALDDDIRNDEASLSAVTQMDQSMNELSRKVRERADEVVQSFTKIGEQEFSIKSVIAAVRLFVPIGLAREGLSRFSSCLNDQIAREAEADMRSLLMDVEQMDDASGASFANAGENEAHILALARLFESVAAYLHDAESAVVDVFGGQSLVALGARMQTQCDVYCEKILVRYSDARSLDQVLRAVRAESASARDLDPLLNELGVLSQRISAYFDFMKKRCLAALPESRADGLEVSESLSDNPAFPFKDSSTERSDRKDLDGEMLLLGPHSPGSIDKIFSSSKLAGWETSFTAQYVELEAYYMRENARKAIRIDELGDESSLTSTAVDDFFFVLQKVVGRAMVYGGKTEALLLVLHHMNSCIGGDLVTYIRSRLRETEGGLEKMHGASTSSSSLPSAALTVSYLAELAKANIPSSGSSSAVTSTLNEGQEGVKCDYFVALNNASVSADYAFRFGASVEQSVARQYGATTGRGHLTGPLAAINDAARTLSSISEQGLAKLGTVLISGVAASTERFLSELNYTLADDSLNLDDPSGLSFSEGFLDDVELKVLHSSIESRLTESNWDSLVRNVSTWVASKVESVLFLPGHGGGSRIGKKFNALGAVRVDRDIRSVSAYFAGKCRRSSVRDVFARLSQISLLINLERPSEVYDVWGGNSGGMTWRLSPSEVRRALMLRVEFHEDAVRMLKL